MAARPVWSRRPYNRPALLHANSFFRTSIDANAAVDAGIGVNDSLLVGHAYSLTRALADTTFASGTFLIIYYCRHSHIPFKSSIKPKKQRRNVTGLYAFYNTFFRKFRQKSTPFSPRPGLQGSDLRAMQFIWGMPAICPRRERRPFRGRVDWGRIRRPIRELG